jgi:hypothetical protein
VVTDAGIKSREDIDRASAQTAEMKEAVRAFYDTTTDTDGVKDPSCARLQSCKCKVARLRDTIRGSRDSSADPEGPSLVPQISVMSAVSQDDSAGKSLSTKRLAEATVRDSLSLSLLRRHAAGVEFADSSPSAATQAVPIRSPAGSVQRFPSADQCRDCALTIALPRAVRVCNAVDHQLGSTSKALSGKALIDYVMEERSIIHTIRRMKDREPPTGETRGAVHLKNPLPRFAQEQLRLRDDLEKMQTEYIRQSVEGELNGFKLRLRSEHNQHTTMHHNRYDGSSAWQLRRWVDQYLATTHPHKRRDTSKSHVPTSSRREVPKSSTKQPLLPHLKIYIAGVEFQPLE